MFRGTWIVVIWSTAAWAPQKSGRNGSGLYRSLFSKKQTNNNYNKKELSAPLFYTYLYIYFSYRLYTTSKKECTKVCYLVHYPTNSIAFDCFPKGKKTILFLFIYVFLSTLTVRNVSMNTVHDYLKVYLYEEIHFARWSVWPAQWYQLRLVTYRFDLLENTFMGVSTFVFSE
jgi:hypothetical protein